MDERNLVKHALPTVKTGFWEKYHWPVLLFVMVWILLAIGGYYIWRYFFPVQSAAVLMSQQQAESAAGIDMAARDKQISMLQSQLEEAARQIEILKNRPPEAIVKTIPIEVSKIVETEREKSGADFAIVTNPKYPNKLIDFNEIKKMPIDTTVNLNQYNVFAYKKIIRGINIYPNWSRVRNGIPGINEITIDTSKRISNKGKYLGVLCGYDLKNEKAKFGLRYTF